MSAPALALEWSRMPYDREAYEAIKRRRRAIERLALNVGYDGPLTDRGLPTALGQFIIDRWRSDDSASSNEKVERLLDALRAAPEVAERELDHYLELIDDAYEGLSVKERRALYFTSLGFQVKEQARFDGVTHDAIKERLRAARRKLGATTTTQAVAIAIRKGLLW